MQSFQVQVKKNFKHSTLGCSGLGSSKAASDVALKGDCAAADAQVVQVVQEPPGQLSQTRKTRKREAAVTLCCLNVSNYPTVLLAASHT